MRSHPMSNQEYDALKAVSPGYRFEGIIQKGTNSITGAKETVLKTKDGMISAFNKLLLSVGGNGCAQLPVGTKVTIDIPAGVTSPFNYFADEIMKFQVQPDGHIEYDN